MVKLPHKFATLSELHGLDFCKAAGSQEKFFGFLKYVGIQIIIDVRFVTSSKVQTSKFTFSLNNMDVAHSEPSCAPNISDNISAPESPGVYYEDIVKDWGVSQNNVTVMAKLLETICVSENITPSLSCLLFVKYFKQMFAPSSCRKYSQLSVNILSENGFRQEQLSELCNLYTSERKNSDKGFGHTVKETSVSAAKQLELKALNSLNCLINETMVNPTEKLKIFRTSLSYDYILCSNWIAHKCAALIGHKNATNLTCNEDQFTENFIYNKRTVCLPQALVTCLTKFLKVRNCIDTNVVNLFVNSNGKLMQTSYSASTLKRLCTI